MVHRMGFGRAAIMAALCSFVWAIMAVSATGYAQTTQFRKDKLTLKTSTGDHVIAIEVAETSEQKALGLMYRTSVPPNTGMLFLYERTQELSMWMKNTYASLDMVFIRADGVVHRIEYSTEPMSERVISSQGAVLAVLELAAGEAKRLGLKPGDRVDYATFKGGRK